MSPRRIVPAALSLLFAAAAALLFGAVQAQPGSSGAPQPQPGTFVGSLKVSSNTWNFDGDIAAGRGPWTLVTVTNTNCTTPYQPGAAQAGAVIYTAALTPSATQSSGTVYSGDLLPFSGATTGSGRVQVITQSGANADTHIDASLWGLSMFALDNTFSVCLTGAPSGTVAGMIAADSHTVASMGYDVSGVVTTPGPNGTSFIAISGVKVPTADGYTQWVFFFNGTSYLGTDTGVPSPQLSLTGSPGPGQINVQYTNYAATDPLCCPSLPPVTITYTFNGSSVTPSGTPPGH